MAVALAFLFSLAAPDRADEARPLASPGHFRGTVYQVDTVFNFVDVILPGGTKRFYSAPASVVRVHGKRAALIDISMGEPVQGTFRTNAKGVRTVVTIDDLAGNERR